MSEYLVSCMASRDFSDDQIVQALEAALAAHPRQTRQVAAAAAEGFARGGRSALLEQLCAGPLASVSPAEQKLLLISAAMCERRFEAVGQYVDQREKLTRLGPFELICRHQAARLSGGPTDTEELRRQLAPHRDNPDWGNVIACLLGELSAEQMLQDSRTDDDRIWSWWLQGVSAEVSGDLTRAMACYRKAGVCHSNRYIRNYAERWAR